VTSRLTSRYTGTAVVPALVADEVADVEARVLLELVEGAQELEVDRLDRRARVERPAWHLDLACVGVAEADGLQLAHDLLAGDVRAGEQLELGHGLTEAGVVEDVATADADDARQDVGRGPVLLLAVPHPHELAAPARERGVEHHREAGGVARVSDKSSKRVCSHASSPQVARSQSVTARCSRARAA
jgi:hypothetical protein